MSVDGGSGILCPLCGCAKQEVRDSRPAVLTIRRRRLCVECGHRFTTYETSLAAEHVGKAIALRNALRALDGERRNVVLRLVALLSDAADLSAIAAALADTDDEAEARAARIAAAALP